MESSALTGHHNQRAVKVTATIVGSVTISSQNYSGLGFGAQDFGPKGIKKKKTSSLYISLSNTTKHFSQFNKTELTSLPPFTVCLLLMGKWQHRR